MRYARTQVYLEPDDHRRLRREAAERGISLAALLREIVANHVREDLAPYRKKGFEAIVGIAETDASDAASDARALGDAARQERLARKLGDTKRRSSRKRSPG